MANLRPTFSESWYRVADLRVKLRPSAQISRQHYRGERWYVVRDPAGNQFHRLSAPAYRFVGLLDGSRTVAEAWELVGGQLADEAPTQNEVIQILSQLHSANLVEANVTPDAAVLLRRHKKMVQRQWQGRLMNVLFPRIPLWDPDTFLVRWMPVVRPFLSRVGAVLWLLVIALAIFQLAPEWPRLQEGAKLAIAPTNWLFLWATFVLIKAIHELGHGFACRRFGGEVHEMGIMFLVLIPAPYVDASTAWGFPSKWARIFVGAGGMIIELFIAALMAFVWLNTQPGTLVNGLAFNTMLIASVSTVIFNANPLLRYDGYYILSDWLEIPNLRYRSTEYTMGLIKRHLFKVKLAQPLPPIKQRIWLFFYAIASTIYRTFVGIMIILMVWREVPVLGQLMALGGVITWLVVPVVKVSRYLLLEPELHRKRTRAILWVGGAVATAIVLVGIIKFPYSYEALGIVEPAVRQVVYARTNGVVDEILVRDAQIVKQGDVLVRCTSRELDLEIEQLNAKMSGLQVRHRDAINRDQNARLMIERHMAAIRDELDKAVQRKSRLVVTAPIDGRVIAPQIRYLKGRFIKEGEQVAVVAQLDQLRVTASIDQADGALPFLKEINEAEIRLAGDPGNGLASGPIVGRVERTAEGLKRMATPTWDLAHPSLGYAGGGDIQTDPADQNGRRLLRPHVEVWVSLPNTDQLYVPGQRAYVRFELDRKPLIWNWSRRVWQLIQSHSNSKWT